MKTWGDVCDVASSEDILDFSWLSVFIKITAAQLSEVTFRADIWREANAKQ